MAIYSERVTMLYNTAKAQGILEKVYQDLQLFKEGVGGETPFMQMMLRENISNSSKASLLVDIAKLLGQDIQDFIQFFVDEAQYQYVYRAIKEFETIYAKHHLDITTAIPLTKEQIHQIVTKLGKKRGKSFDTWSQVIDSTIIGGVCVKSYDFIIDTTLETQLIEFKKTFRQ